MNEGDKSRLRFIVRQAQALAESIGGPCKCDDVELLGHPLGGEFLASFKNARCEVGFYVKETPEIPDPPKPAQGSLGLDDPRTLPD